MKRLSLLIVALLLAACASTGLLQTLQITHDSLATAQDLEAQLCWGVPNVAAVVADRTHCTTTVATTIGLTTERHNKLNARLATAFNLHKGLTQQAKAGAGHVDTAALATLIDSILSIIGELQQTPAVAQLASTVKAGQLK